MTPHPVASWVQMTVSRQRAVRQRRRRRAAQLLLSPTPRLPQQRRSPDDGPAGPDQAVDRADAADERGTIWRRR